MGVDFAGVVVKLGSDASTGRFKVGDTVAGIVQECKTPVSVSPIPYVDHGVDGQPAGTFAEYVAAI